MIRYEYVYHVAFWKVLHCEEFELVYNITVGLPIVVYRPSLTKGLSNPYSSQVFAKQMPLRSV